MPLIWPKVTYTPCRAAALISFGPDTAPTSGISAGSHSAVNYHWIVFWAFTKLFVQYLVGNQCRNYSQLAMCHHTFRFFTENWSMTVYLNMPRNKTKTAVHFHLREEHHIGWSLFVSETTGLKTNQSFLRKTLILDTLK